MSAQEPTPPDPTAYGQSISEARQGECRPSSTTGMRPAPTTVTVVGR